jgi:hypothetical protein
MKTALKIAAVGCACIMTLSVWGCGNNSNSSNLNNAGDGFLVPAGNYSIQKQLTTNDPAQYTFGCATPGTQGATPQVDPRLQEGMVFDYTVQGLATSASINFKLNAGITVVNPPTATEIDESFQVFSVSGISGIAPGATATGSCTLANGNFTCSYDSQIPPTSNNINACSTTNSVPATVSYDEGVFTTQNGNGFTAYRETVTFSGGMTCGTQNLTGTIKYVAVTSNDVPSVITPDFCGGTPIFVGLAMATSDGNVTALAVEQTGFSASGKIHEPGNRLANSMNKGVRSARTGGNSNFLDPRKPLRAKLGFLFNKKSL